VESEGVFSGTRSRVAIPYNYGQSSSSTGAISSEPSRNLSQWLDDEGEASGYASSATVSSEQIGFMSVNMANKNPDDDLCRYMEAQEQTSKAQREALETSSKC